MLKKRKNIATDEELKLLSELVRQKAFEILEKPAKELFSLSPAMLPVPERARIEPSKPFFHIRHGILVEREKSGRFGID